MSQPTEVFLPGVPVGLPAQESPDRFHQEHPDVFVSVPIDVPEALHSAAGVFARTTPGVTPDRFAPAEPLPVAHFPFQQGQGERAQPLREAFRGHPRFD